MVLSVAKSNSTVHPSCVRPAAPARRRWFTKRSGADGGNEPPLGRGKNSSSFHGSCGSENRNLLPVIPPGRQGPTERCPGRTGLEIGPGPKMVLKKKKKKNLETHPKEAHTFQNSRGPGEVRRPGRGR